MFRDLLVRPFVVVLVCVAYCAEIVAWNSRTLIMMTLQWAHVDAPPAPYAASPNFRIFVGLIKSVWFAPLDRWRDDDTERQGHDV